MTGSTDHLTEGTDHLTGGTDHLTGGIDHPTENMATMAVHQPHHITGIPDPVHLQYLILCNLTEGSTVLGDTTRTHAAFCEK